MWRETTTKLDRRRTLLRGMALLLLMLVLVLAAYFYGRSQSLAGLSEEDQESVALYAEALDAVKDDYVDQEAVDPDRQTYGAIEGMLESLGDGGHTRFLAPEEVEANRDNLSGKYVGIGVQLDNRDDATVVSAPIDGSPADEAGIRTGDVLVAVNGESVEGQEMAQIAEKVRGPEGSTVGITVRRGEEDLTFEIEREELPVEAVTWNLLPGTDVAHLRLASFSEGAAEQLRAAINEARAAGAERFVLDLRGNPGGRVDQAVAVAETFLDPEDVIYVRRDADGEEQKVRASDEAEDSVDAPLTVLVDGDTASSAEIVAGALRDNDRAQVVGETTFGTGTVLAEQDLSDGSAILLGIAEWLTPSGDFIREIGIEPGIEAKLGEGQEPLTPAEAKDLSAEEIFSRDAQLERAVEVLREGEG